ncbi:S26 family signal peptidase [Sphingomonas sp.]|jgi:conjugative transfer signal peptidase TraF|uniref:S26 family signal peptidase n=1 Tax=Sphingomonas sp. TaxID=28214 RepID=UPI002E14E68B|nr:S26 family signal peptidase [Sphingomonas sp.]HEV7290450.1 S26 family signal peptidase [Sphingomonas sp.]
MSARRTSTGDAPLLAWGEALRAARRTRQLRVAALGIGAGVLALAGTIVAPPAPRLLWNASASAPIGLYRVAPGTPAAVGDMVIARVPLPWRRLAAVRGYLPQNVPLVKRVAAVAGSEVCASGAVILVGGRVVARRLRRDGQGRAMPWWSGCVRLSGRQQLLLMDAPGSFDGRYFGVTEGADIVGRAVLLWQR